MIVHAEEVDVNGISKKHKGSLYMSFKYLYDYIWNHSRDISEWVAQVAAIQAKSSAGTGAGEGGTV